MSTENLKRLNSRLIQKNDTSANWETASNNGFVPLKGEIIIYTDLNKIKIGDGVTVVGNLEFFGGDAASVIPGDFLELDEDGKLNVVPSYTIPEEEVTEEFDISMDAVDYDSDNGKYYFYCTPSRTPKSVVSYSHEDGPDGDNMMGDDEFEIDSIELENGQFKVILMGYFEDYSGDGRIVTITYVAEEEVRSIAKEYSAGKFIDIDSKNNISVSTTYAYQAGTATQTSTTFSYVDMDTYKATIYSEYPINEVTDFQYNVSGQWESTSGYTISTDRRSISYTYGPCSELYIKATYSYNAGELSLFDGIERMTVESSMYGSTLPTSGQEGQVFFLLK